MKQLTLWIGLFLMLLLPLGVNAQDGRIGTVKSLSGEVVLSKAGAQRNVFAGQGVQETDRLVTGANAHVSMTLKDGTSITAGPNTIMELPRGKFDSTTEDGSLMLSLLQGTIRVVTGWLGKTHPEQFKVVTPTSVVGVRGTDFIVEVP